MPSLCRKCTFRESTKAVSRFGLVGSGSFSTRRSLALTHLLVLGKTKSFTQFFQKIADSKESVFGCSSQQAKHPELNKFNSGCSSEFLKV